MGVVAALAALREAGLPVIAVTGRPMGWSRAVARADAARRGRRRERRGRAGPRRRRRSRRLRRPRAGARAPTPCACAPSPRASSPRCRARRWRATAPAGSPTSRSTTPSSRTSTRAQIDAVVALMRREGMNATVSSIHVNGWFGAHTKLSGASWIVRRLLGRDLDAERDDWLYVGDSTNDEPMFASVPALGRRRQHRRLRRPADSAGRRTSPRSIAARGFVEVAEALARRARRMSGPARPLRWRRATRMAGDRVQRGGAALSERRAAADARSSPPRSPSARRSRSAWRASRTRCCCRRCAPTSAGATSSPAR